MPLLVQARRQPRNHVLDRMQGTPGSHGRPGQMCERVGRILIQALLACLLSLAYPACGAWQGQNPAAAFPRATEKPARWAEAPAGGRLRPFSPLSEVHSWLGLRRRRKPGAPGRGGGGESLEATRGIEAGPLLWRLRCVQSCVFNWQGRQHYEGSVAFATATPPPSESARRNCQEQQQQAALPPSLPSRASHHLASRQAGSSRRGEGREGSPCAAAAKGLKRSSVTRRRARCPSQPRPRRGKVLQPRARKQANGPSSPSGSPPSLNSRLGEHPARRRLFPGSPFAEAPPVSGTPYPPPPFAGRRSPVLKGDQQPGIEDVLLRLPRVIPGREAKKGWCQRVLHVDVGVTQQPAPPPHPPTVRRAPVGNGLRDAPSLPPRFPGRLSIGAATTQRRGMGRGGGGWPLGGREDRSHSVDLAQLLFRRNSKHAARGEGCNPPLQSGSQPPQSSPPPLRGRGRPIPAPCPVARALSLGSPPARPPAIVHRSRTTPSIAQSEGGIVLSKRPAPRLQGSQRASG